MLLVPVALADDVSPPAGTHLGFGAGLETSTGSGVVFYQADLDNGLAGSYDFSWWVTGSVRLRFGNGLTLEPDLGCGTGSSAALAEDGDSASFDTTNCRVGLSVRPRIAARGSLELYALGGVGYAWSSVDWQDGGGADHHYEVTTGDVFADGGLSAQKWLTQDITLGVDVRVLTFQYRVVAQDAWTAGPWRSSSWSVALDPGARLMLHLYW